MIRFNLFTIGGLSLFLFCIILVLINIILGRKKIHFIWSLFNLSVAIWGFGAFMIGNNLIQKKVWFWWKVSHIGVIWMPVFILHTVHLLTTKVNKKILIFAYIQAIFFQIIDFMPFNLFFRDLRFVFSKFYYVTLGPLYHPFFLLWILLVLYAHICIYKEYSISTGMRRLSLLYFLFGSILGFSGGFTNFLIGYKLDIPPYGNFTIPIYCIAATYAIIKHHLMDIKIALTRAGIFIFVYLFVLGIPFILGYRYSQWKLATYLTVFLASTGPFIYLYLKRQVENIILKEQHRYQKTLREFSKNLTYIHELDKLFQIIVSKIVEEVRVKFGAIYLKDDEYKFYKLKYCFPEKETFRFSQTLPLDDPLIETLYNKKIPILSDEINIKDKIKIDTGLFIPCFIEDNLLSFIVLGPKSNKQIYTNNDLIIFETLSYYISLAIENSLFFKKLEEQQRKARIQEMDIFSYSIVQKIQPKDMDKKSCIPNKSTI